MNHNFKWLTIFILFALSTTAMAKEYQFRYVLDDTGRPFYPGDYIQMNMSLNPVKRVVMDCRGYRGATATLYVNGQAKGTKSLRRRRGLYHWNLSRPIPTNQLEIRFGDVDPQVYSVKVIYDAEVEIKIKTVIEYVKVPKKQISEQATSLLDLLDELYRRAQYHNIFGPFLDEAVRIAEELNFYADKSMDSDASQFTNRYAIELIKTIDCPKAQAIMRRMGKESIGNRKLVRSIRRIIVVLREMTDYFRPQCSDFTNCLDFEYQSEKGQCSEHKKQEYQDQDEPTQDEPTQDEPTQDEPTQDEQTQDEPTQDEPTQDEQTQDEQTQDEQTQDEQTQDEQTQQ